MTDSGLTSFQVGVLRFVGDGVALRKVFEHVKSLSNGESSRVLADLQRDGWLIVDAQWNGTRVVLTDKGRAALNAAESA